MSKEYVILITGSRKYTDIFPMRDMLFEVIANVDDDKELVIVHGGAEGADWTAGFWANLYDIECRVYFADWKTHGKKAGPIRNSEMLEKENVDIVLAFPGPNSIGTWDMIKKAKANNIKTIIKEVNK